MIIDPAAATAAAAGRPNPSAVQCSPVTYSM